MLLCMILHYILPINITMYEFIIIEWKIYQICKVYNFKSFISCKKGKCIIYITTLSISQYYSMVISFY